MLTNLVAALDAAKKEVADVTTVTTNLTEAEQQLAAARSSVDEAQGRVDSARASINTETDEAVAALRTVIAEAETEIERLRPTAPPAPTPPVMQPGVDPGEL